jgi:NAD(P) transhydrogenase subunit alpha
MKIAVLRERIAGERRVAATPETVGKLIGLGATVTIEAGAGQGARIADADYVAAGAQIGPTTADTVAGADIILTVRRPPVAALKGAAPGVLVIGALDPYGNETEIAALAKADATAIAMEFMPRITRAQVMDVLSSQANLAGYQAVIEAAGAFERAFPMMMTAAGTVRPAKVFVMGAGVAGLQAIATAKRLGAVVSATDVRAAVGEQVESLGAKFIMTDALKDASGAGGYARELTKDEQAAQAGLVAEHIAKQDIVITTALIPGRPAPKLVTAAMVDSMAPGSVIVDLAAERGGNVEVTVAGQTITHGGATVIGLTNLQGRIPTTASQLYARNLLAFIETLVDKAAKRLAINWDDELVKATVLTRDGVVVHPAFANAAPADPVAAMPPVELAKAPAKTGATAKTGARKAVAAPAEVEAKAPAKRGTASATKPAAAKPKTARPKAPAKADVPAPTSAAPTDKPKRVRKPAPKKGE